MKGAFSCRKIEITILGRGTSSVTLPETQQWQFKMPILILSQLVTLADASLLYVRLDFLERTYYRHKMASYKDESNLIIYRIFSFFC